MLLAGTFAAIAAQPSHQGHHPEKPAAVAPPAEAVKPVNDRCPIQGEEVDPEAPARMWRGQAIGFCCPGCETEWDAKPDAEKDAFLARYTTLAEPSQAVRVARQFHEGLAAGDLSAIDRLFLQGGRASVLENGTDEGTWERYREEHLKPELKELTDYEWRTSAEAEDRLGAASIVRQTGVFTIGAEKSRKSFITAITLVVVDDGGQSRIAHMHWSSRELKPEKK
ncbi:MAG: hypothetical protein IT436_15045 [Phycisphaerales bacterium]|nr:hypothetical protein [Phycisphaerales bacterium]